MASWDILYVRDGRQVSDVDEGEVRRLLSSGGLALDDCLRRQGETRWRRVAELKSRSQKEDDSQSASESAPESATAAEDDSTNSSPRRPIRVEAAPVAAEAGHGHDDHDDEVHLGVKREEVEPLDMTPMVDVVLLLLLFFMVTASYSMQKIMSIPKPDPVKNKPTSQSRKDIKKEYIIVELDHRNQILVDDDPLKNRSIVEALRTAGAEGGKQKVFLIADGESFNGVAIQIMDAAADAGMERPIMYSVRTDD